MSELQFVWDENKNQKNIEKHGISFAEARDVFYDDNAIEATKDEKDYYYMGMVN